MKKGSARSSGWTVEKLDPSDILTDLFSKNIEEATASPRSPAFFDYLTKCPVAKVSLHGLSKAGQQQGHFALVLIRGQARVAGVWLRDPTLENWRAAYSLTQQTAAHLKDAYEIATSGTTEVSAEAAAQSGLRVTPGRPVYLLNKKGRFTVPKDFQFQLSDDDAIFFDSGDSAYWT